ncbi:MAG: response regulator transcription factor [Verrucomicrobiales bacterium]|nr:response regulator transcription factor [Verrucomicrobiales bacterium]
MRVLFVEDSCSLRNTVSLALRKSGYAVDSTGDGRDGLFLVENHRYDVAVLDIMLPGLDGLSLLQCLREKGCRTPVLLLTARSAIADRVRGLLSGADDYLIKPFALEELIARVGALSRRGFRESSNILRVADLKLNSAAKTVERNGTPIQLKPREFALLELLMRQAGEVVSRADIDEHLYEDDSLPMSNVIDASIYSIRRKIQVDDSSEPLIHTRRGQGYILEPGG